jgi:transposase-like protein
MDGGSGAARKRAAFLRALGQGGSIAEAAREAGVHRATVYGWKRRIAGFAQALAEALAAGQAALAAGGAPCAMDQAVWQGERQKPRVTRIKAGTRWTAAVEQRFLDALAGECNVSAAARAAGFSNTSAYGRRRRLPAFRAEWDAALDEGWARLQAKLLRQAANGIAPAAGDGPARIAEPDEDRAIADTALALNLLKQHQAAGRGRGGGGALGGPEPSIEAARDKVLAGVRGLRRAREK